MPDQSLIPLSFENQQIRVTDQDGNPWFVAADVCRALRIKNVSDAIAKLEGDEKGVVISDTLGGPQEMAILSEAGVYTLALRCRDAMKPGTAPYQFRKWVTGVALPALRKGHEPGVIHGIDRGAMGALGGMMKGIIAKALAELVPQMVQAQIASQHYSVARGLTAGEVIEEAGIKNRKGLRGLPRKVSDKLRRFSAEKGVPVNVGSLGSTSAYVFDLSLVREWLMAGGKQFIERVADEKRGQGALRLVEPRG
jgi:hypothetical protein